ncbi:DUF6118 family protein [Acidocella aromatica]|uniref:Uncharacterized protein n=1 Tax=Acidocella aromatica TaxID=1303579 RepID=A0A840VN37_9PROT|nr:DUF6118 family protein [Acidocella aromatica]MBB5374535.1 hypothetical protein [Acidocella aromatica]
MEHEVDRQDEAGDPAQAFEDLRAEVSVMRRAVEALPQALAENRPPAPHDYRSDIGKVAQGLAAVADRLGEIEKHPALRLTPDAYSQAIVRAGTSVMSVAGQKLDTATQKINLAGDQLVGLIGTVRGQDEQRSWLMWTGLVALVLGVLLSPLVAVALPFGGGNWVGAFIIESHAWIPSRWNAGWALLQAADQVGAQQAAVGLNLVRDNQAAIAACQEVAIRSRKDQSCTVIVKVPVGLNSP